MSLVPARHDMTEIAPQTWAIMKEQASILVKSGLLPNSIKSGEQALAIMMKGRELKIPPMQAFSHISIIQGKPCIGAELMLALIYRNIPGVKVEFERLDSDGCTIRTTRPGHKPTVFKFELADAEAAQLLSKDNWKKYPRAMFRSRAISEMARSQYPDAIMGCSYTPEEMGAEVDEDGEVVDVPSSPAPAKVAPPPPPPPPPRPKRPYDGSPEHAHVLKEVLRQRKIPEEFWEEIEKKMLGKAFEDLGPILEEVRQKEPVGYQEQDCD